nr:tRNA 2-thiouridine(34) synthase MnmA [Anaerolineaceae bacterium]
MEKVFIALSGGVDSSVAAFLLVEAGFQVEGIMLRLWTDPFAKGENKCCSLDSVNHAHRTAKMLGIPFHLLDYSDRFKNNIVDHFIESYRIGLTPNPCVHCNRLIKWGQLLKEIQKLGGDYLATGHYARLLKAPDGKVELFTGLDPKKDQAYVLSYLKQEQLAKTILPLGEKTKSDVRKIALKNKMSSAKLPDSQDLCFVGEQNYKEFLRNYAPETYSPGLIV